jgi:hypothetical protein
MTLHGTMMNTLLDLHWHRSGVIMGQPFTMMLEPSNKKNKNKVKKACQSQLTTREMNTPSCTTSVLLWGDHIKLTASVLLWGDHNSLQLVSYCGGDHNSLQLMSYCGASLQCTANVSQLYFYTNCTIILEAEFCLAINLKIEIKMKLLSTLKSKQNVNEL